MDLSYLTSLPEYQELLRKRRAIARPLALIVLLSYYSFILLVAYAPSFLGTPIGGTIATYGIVYGLCLILLTFAVTAFFVWYTNKHVEGLVEQIQEKAAAHD